MKFQNNLLLASAFASSVLAGTPSSGTVYIGAAYGTHNVYKVNYQYDGVGTMTATTSILATLPTAADAAIVSGGDIIVAGQGPNVYKINSVDGSHATVSSGNNGNTISLDPGGASVWIGWSDAMPSQVPLKPFANGTTHVVSGDDHFITQLAFTPSDGVFYSTGGPGAGNFGRIDMSGFTTTRLLAATNASGLIYDAFSRSLILAAFGHATQRDTASPTVALSTRDDSGAIDGLSGGVAVDTAIFADGFEVRR